MNRLQEEINRLQAKQKLLESWEEHINSETALSPTEKVKRFNSLYAEARRYVLHCITHGYGSKDGKHYLFEHIMNKTLGEGVWKIISAACEG